jgi:hypothetical protein
MIYKCKICGKTWDDDGCSVSLVPNIEHEIEFFICEDCKEVSE